MDEIILNQNKVEWKIPVRRDFLHVPPLNVAEAVENPRSQGFFAIVKSSYTARMQLDHNAAYAAFFTSLPQILWQKCNFFYA
ncbi:MAG: hypothetical protein LBD38_02315 [Streptococcaceae bacterium]|jgi:hypothetical protein|nr:hypothetical protein [Streptococcaceae bacterium]